MTPTKKRTFKCSKSKCGAERDEVTIYEAITCNKCGSFMYPIGVLRRIWRAMSK